MTDGAEKDRKPAKSREDSLRDMFTPEVRSAIEDVNNIIDSSLTRFWRFGFNLNLLGLICSPTYDDYGGR